VDTKDSNVHASKKVARGDTPSSDAIDNTGGTKSPFGIHDKGSSFDGRKKRERKKPKGTAPRGSSEMPG